MKKRSYQHVGSLAAGLILISSLFIVISGVSAMPQPAGRVDAGLTSLEWGQIRNQIGDYGQTAYLKASNAESEDGFGYSVAISGDTLVIGAPYESSNGSEESDNSAADAGAVYVFIRSGSTWIQQAYLKASNVEAGDHFGYSVDISGDTIVVGAFGEDGNGSSQADNTAGESGAAYVFVRSGGIWVQQAYLKASNIDIVDQFGASVAISGDTVVVGALTEDGDGSGETNNDASGSGAVYVFVRSGLAWSQEAYLKASTVGADDHFGESIAIDGDTLVIGVKDEDSDGSDEGDDSASSSGAAYVFVRSDTTWTQQAYLKASNVDASDYFGYSVDISVDTVVVGASKESGDGSSQANNSAEDAGAAYVFVRNGDTWDQQAYLKASSPDGGDAFGLSVGISGDSIVVGAFHEDSDGSSEDDDSLADSGAAYVFVRSGTTWDQELYLKASNLEAEDSFGQSCDISDEMVLVGAADEDSDGSSEEDNSETISGAGYVYRYLNYQPTADAGLDQDADILTLVNLDGSASSDPDGDTPLTYQWTQTDGTPVSLTGANTATPSFTAPTTKCSLTFSLVVTDSLGLASDADAVTIEVQGQQLFLPVIVK